jgi:hypothetical protein
MPTVIFWVVILWPCGETMFRRTVPPHFHPEDGGNIATRRHNLQIHDQQLLRCENIKAQQ